MPNFLVDRQLLVLLKDNVHICSSKSHELNCGIKGGWGGWLQRKETPLNGRIKEDRLVHSLAKNQAEAMETSQL